MRPSQPQPRALLLLTETYANGGIQRFNRTFLTACTRLGVTCDVLSLCDDEESRVRWKEPHGVSIRVFGRNKLRFSAAATVAVLRGNYDFVIVGHANLLELAAISLVLRRARSARTLLIAHGIEVWAGMAAPARKLATRAVDLVLCVSRYTRDCIRSQNPLPESRFRIFPNALGAEWAARCTAERSLELPEAVRKPFLLSVTRINRGDRAKGIDKVMEALARLRDHSVNYVIAGRGDDEDYLRSVAANLGLSGRVHFAGALTDAQLAGLFRECRAFVLPSGKEGFGIVFLEAMFFGAPVIAAAAKGAVDVVQHEHTGLLVGHGDVDALQVAIERVHADATLREKLRAAGRAAVTGDGPFTFEAYVTRLADVFEMPLPSRATEGVAPERGTQDRPGPSGPASQLPPAAARVTE